MKLSEREFELMYQSALRNEWTVFMPEKNYYAEDGFYSWLLKKGLHNTLNLDIHRDAIQIMMKPHTYDQMTKYGVKSYNVLSGDKIYNARMTKLLNSEYRKNT